MTARVIHDHQNIEKQMEKQMGCMAGFLQIFDRNQFLAGKRVYASKRLSSPPTDSASQSEKSEELPSSCEQEKQEKLQLQNSPEPEKCFPSPEISLPAVLPINSNEIKEVVKSTWKFRECPRLSLDSQAIVDGKGSLYPREIRTTAAILSATNGDASEDENDKQRRSPSVVARLMGLDALPESFREPLKKPELRRSASESRSRDSPHNRFLDENRFHQKQINTGSYILNNAIREGKKSEAKSSNVMEVSVKKPKQQQCKNHFDTKDLFHEPKLKDSLYGELEKRLKMRGISKPAEDLETLKQILEGLQLKGLLRSSRKLEQIANRNFIFDRKFPHEEAPIVIMKPSKSPVSGNLRSKSGIRRNINVSCETLPPVRRKLLDRSGNENERRLSNSMSPDRNESSSRSPCSPARRKVLNVETQRRRNDSVEQRRISPVHSPRMSPRKNGPDQLIRSPRSNRRSTADICSKERIISSPTEDESSSISETSSGTISLKSQRLKEGKNVLARCDKLVNSIAEITTESQPSPVSVLDSSFYRDDLSPLKRSIEFQDQSIELEGNWSPVVSPVRLKSKSVCGHADADADFMYVSEIIEALECVSQKSNLFFLLEKEYYKSSSSSVSKLHRKLVFDVVAEILDEKQQLSQWNATGKSSFQQVWLEFSRVREQPPAQDMFEVICGILRKDLADEKTINGWGVCAIESSEMVLDIERLIFKDLVGEAIQDLATFTGQGRGLVPKKLVF